jgi:hypothetical protein
MTSFRRDRIDDLMHRVREHWGQQVQPRDDAQSVEVRRDNPQQVQGPSHRRLTHTQDVFSRHIEQGFTPELFGRKAQHRPVARGEAAHLKYSQPPPTAYGQAALSPPSAEGERSLPGLKARDQKVSDAMNWLEQRGRLAARRLNLGLRGDSKLAVGSRTPSAAHVPTKAALGGGEKDIFVPQETPKEDLTNLDFAYVAGQSHFEKLSAGAKVASGEGHWVDWDRTQTAFGRPIV